MDDKYYLSDEAVNSIVQHCKRKRMEGCGFTPNFKDADGISTTITSGYGTKQTDTYYIEEIKSS